MKFCTKCGYQAKDDDTFCYQCGNKLNTEESQNIENKPKNNVENKNGGKHSQENNDENNAGVWTIIIICIIIGAVIGFMDSDYDEKVNNEPVEFKIEYETNPITGQSHITSINNTTTEDITDSVMNWLGFEKVESGN